MVRKHFYLNTSSNTYILRVGKNFSIEAKAWRDFHFGFKHIFKSSAINLFRIKSVRR